MDIKFVFPHQVHIKVSLTRTSPYKFQAPWHAFEFAFHILEMESNLVIISMAWMTREDPRKFTRMPNEPDMETLTYWITRLEPLIRSDSDDEIIVVFCNRTGNEDEALYAGTSAVVGIHDGEVKVYGLLGRGEKELLVIDTEEEPYAKLVYRPEAGGPGMEAPGHLEKPGDSKFPDASIPDFPASASIHASDAKGTSRLPTSSLPPLPQLPKELANDLPRRRRAPSIDIPNNSDFVNSNLARSPTSPGSHSLNIPTPSAPSPTPMAIRPRLIIPESPPILPHQYPADHPISAASLRSEKSIQSVKSNESEASTRTIRSNPRPPEESTPYPDSGAPLSGYPSNFFSPERRIYGGDVTISSAEPFSPDTPFEDISPVASSPQYYWRPSDNLMRTPASAGAWTPGTPIGRKPEPFPWPAITGNARLPSRSGAKDRQKDNATPTDLRHLSSQSPLSNTSSNRTAKSSKTTRSEASVTSKGTVQASSNKELARPPSTKSRNASRTGMHERPGSSLGDGSSKAVSQHLENISLRAESANRMRAGSANGTRTADRSDRPQSPQSRSSSRTRPSEITESQREHHMIHIAASPSILDNNRRNTYQSFSRVAHHQRSNSSTANRPYGTGTEPMQTPSSGASVGRPGPRAASRGRTPGPKVAPSSGMSDSATEAIERASSADSTRNDELHTRIQQHRSRAERTSSTQNGRRQSDEGISQGFERVEAIVCPSCPVHGRRSSSSATPHREISISATHSPPTPSPTQRPASSVGVSQTLEPEPGPTEPRRVSSCEASQPPLETPQKPANKDSQSLPQNYTSEASDCGSFTETLATVSTPGPSPATPYFFYPPTPRAMALSRDDTDIEPLSNSHLDGSDDAPTAQHTKADVLSTFVVATGAVA